MRGRVESTVGRSGSGDTGFSIALSEKAKGGDVSNKLCSAFQVSAIRSLSPVSAYSLLFLPPHIESNKMVMDTTHPVVAYIGQS